MQLEVSMTESSPETPKKPRPRRRTASSGAAVERIKSEAQSGPAENAIEDALAEAHAARDDADFGETPPPRRRRKAEAEPAEAAAPRRRTRKPREEAQAAAPAPRDDDSDFDAGLDLDPRLDFDSRMDADGPARSSDSRPAPRRRTDDGDSAPARRDAGPVADRGEEHDAQDSGGFDDGPDSSEAGDSGDSGDDGNRRRRRRRRRRRGPNDGPAPQGGGGSHGSPHGNRGPSHQGGRDRRRGSDNRNENRGSRGPRESHSQSSRVPETPTPVQGILELHPTKGYGFLRDQKSEYISQPTDPFVSSSLIEKFGLREGVLVTGESVPGGKGQGPRLRSIETIEGRTPDMYREIKSFDSLTPITPHNQIRLETGPTPVTMRVMDLLTPIGKGQRALIVAPPRSGKTMLLQEIANAVSHNHPEVYLIVLLIDERPEEVTELRRRVNGEVIASTLDREVDSHIRVSQLVFERAKRMTEQGRDVFILLDSITRTARAFNKWSNSGRTGTGGLDIRAMDLPKKMFGMARQFEEGGSLTVVGTALIETGSRMDDAIFQEFKGTGNMELVLSRELADRRIWPAIDVAKSGTRREEKLLPPDVLEGVTMLRRSLVSLNSVEAMEQLIRILAKYPTNAEFLAKIRSVL